MDCMQSKRVSPKHDDKVTRHHQGVPVTLGNVARVRALDVLPADSEFLDCLSNTALDHKRALRSRSHAQCPLLALSGHWSGAMQTSAFDLKRTAWRRIT